MTDIARGSGAGHIASTSNRGLTQAADAYESYHATANVVRAQELTNALDD